jgi:4-hydroxy-tetrahydrodipicolinate synthase
MANQTGWNRREFLAAAMLPAYAAPQAKPMRGIFVIMMTPYTPALEVDYETLGREVDFLDRCGVHGMVWPQLASEVGSLKREERLRGMEVLAKAAKGKRPALVLGVQGEDKDEALLYAKRAEELEPDAFIAMPPKKASRVEEFRDYYTALAGTTRRPIFMQTTGGPPKMTPPVEMIVALAREFPNLGYVKEEAQPVIERMRELARSRPAIRAIFSGNGGRAMLHEMRLGFDGTMPGSPLTDLYVRIWDLYQSNRRDEARDLFAKLNLLLTLSQEIPGTLQYIFHKRGVTKTVLSRQRKIALDKEQMEEIDFQLAVLAPYFRA